MKDNPKENMAGAIRNKLTVIKMSIKRIDFVDDKRVSQAIEDINRLCDNPILSAIYPYRKGKE